MTPTGSVFTATLAPDQLWNGMTVYVVVSDTVGHTVEGEHQTLLVSAPVPGGDHNNKSAGMTTQESWWFTSGGVGSMATVVLSAFILLFYVYRRKDSEDFVDEEPAPREKPVSMSAASLIKAAQKAAVESVHNVQPSYVPIGAVRASATAHNPPARQAVAAAQGTKREAFSLLDAIPSVRIRADEISDAGYKSFMAELEGLQRELTTLQRKRSAYQEPEVQSLLEIENDLDIEKPSIIRGLRLRSMMQ
jgi:hypothetical protein